MSGCSARGIAIWVLARLDWPGGIVTVMLQLEQGAARADVDQEQELARLRLGGDVDVAGQHAQRRAGERDGAHL